MMHYQKPKALAQTRVLGTATIVLAAFVMASCTSAERPQQFRAYFVPPPARPKPPMDRPVVEAPSTSADRFGGELPFLTTVSTSTLPSLPRPTDADFLIRRADNFF